MATTSRALPQVMQVQRRTVIFLGSAQLLSGIGTGVTVSIGSLLAVELSGSEAWAGSVATLMTLAAALAALPLASLADRRGRRIGLVTGLTSALAGALLMILSVVTGIFVLLILGAAGVGVGTAANLQARFAAVDLADPEHRGRSLSAVVWAITIGAVAGPNLVQPGAVVGQALGLPAIAGPFVISAAGLFLSCVLLLAGLRPDPLLLSRELAAAELSARAGGIQDGSTQQPGPSPETSPESPGKLDQILQDSSTMQPDILQPDTEASASQAPAQHAPAQHPLARRGALVRGLQAARGSRQAMLALAAIIGAHGIMVAIMSMTPLHLQALVDGPGASHAGHVGADTLVIIGFTISLHIAGMFALSPVMGLLTDKAGRTQTIALGYVTLLAAVLVAGFGQGSTAAVATGLVLLGLGWSAANISGSTLLAESVRQQDRVVVQGVSDMLMGAAGAVGGAFSGLVLSWVGYQGLNMAGGLVGAAVLAAAVVALLASRTRKASPSQQPG